MSHQATRGLFWLTHVSMAPKVAMRLSQVPYLCGSQDNLRQLIWFHEIWTGSCQKWFHASYTQKTSDLFLLRSNFKLFNSHINPISQCYSIWGIVITIKCDLNKYTSTNFYVQIPLGFLKQSYQKIVYG